MLFSAIVVFKNIKMFLKENEMYLLLAQVASKSETKLFGCVSCKSFIKISHFLLELGGHYE